MPDRNIIFSIPKEGYDSGNGYTINFSGYYTDICKRNLPYFHGLNLKLTQFEEKRKNSLSGYINSTWSRYEYALFLSDSIIKINAESRIDNDSQFLIETYTYNFIITVYSILDSLAWIVNHWYLFDLHRMKVTLNFYETSKQKLLKKVKTKNEALFNYLSFTKTQDWINYLQEYRDQIQHRSKLHIIPQDSSHMVIELKPGLCEFYPNLENESFEVMCAQTSSQHGDIFQPIDVFCKNHINQITKLIERISRMLN